MKNIFASGYLAIELNVNLYWDHTPVITAVSSTIKKKKQKINLKNYSTIDRVNRSNHIP